MFLLIMQYIWSMRYTHPLFWIVILGLVMLSHLCHHEQAEGLGFRRANFARCLEELAPVLILLALALLGTGMVFQTTRPITFDQGLVNLAAYWPWGLVQQYLVNSYFLNRMQSVSNPRRASWISAAMFSGAHLPNLFLMAVTFGAGFCGARVYLKYRNLYFLGLAHGIIGFLLYLVVPDSISHHLNVGPGWFR